MTTYTFVELSKEFDEEVINNIMEYDDDIILEKDRSDEGGFDFHRILHRVDDNEFQVFVIIADFYSGVWDETYDDFDEANAAIYQLFEEWREEREFMEWEWAHSRL